jgi:small-conductance mechanosensitive channel
MRTAVHARTVRLTALFLAVVFLMPAVPAATAPASAPIVVPDAPQVIAFLNQSIAWYRHLAVEQQLATELSDLSFVDDDRRLANEAVRLSFDFARADSEVLTKARAVPESAGQEGSAASSNSSLTAIAAKADQQVKQLQAERDAWQSKLDAASGKRREEAQSALAETNSEIQLAETRRDVLQNMVAFVGGASAADSGASNLRAQIEELARTVPAASAKEADAGSTTSGDHSKPASVLAESRHLEPSGILALVSDVFALYRKTQTLGESIRMVQELEASSASLRGPLGAGIKSIVQQGNTLGNPSGSTDPAVMARQKANIDALTAQFKDLAAVVLPLAKQHILLDQYVRSLGSWHDAVSKEYTSELKSLLLRLAVLLLMLGLVFCGAEFWRRAIVRYVQDTRRRHQLLLVRRIVCWLLLAVILISAFATELSSLATFAGLITAGVALALQSVILAIAGYFFLIGKYGVRIGDRVQIGSISGEVVDIGLVRMHLMEFESAAADAQPTGRIVAFSNAVVFQPTGGIFKQIPGASFLWHEVKLSLSRDNDYHQVEERLTEAVKHAFAEFQEEMEAQRRRMENNLRSVVVQSLLPILRMHWTQGGLEVVIQYPVEQGKAAAVDGRIARALLDAIDSEPKLKMEESGEPIIHPVQEPGTVGKS